VANEDTTPDALDDTRRALADQIKAWHEAFPERSIASINGAVYDQRKALGKAKLRSEAAAKNTTVAALTEQRYAENARTRQHEDELRRAAEEECARTRSTRGQQLCKEEGCPRFARLPHS
jgi:hypothetical protein